jgi:hypothetical protein
MIGVSNNFSKYKITVYHFSQVLYDLYEHYLFFSRVHTSEINR